MQNFFLFVQLETDESILISKARGAIEKYGHKAVIGNIMQTRKSDVVFVYPNGREPEHITLGGEEIAQGKEIEEQIIAKLVQQHENFIRTETDKF